MLIYSYFQTNIWYYKCTVVPTNRGFVINADSQSKAICENLKSAFVSEDVPPIYSE